MVLFVSQFYPVGNFGEFINFGLGTVKGYAFVVGMCFQDTHPFLTIGGLVLT